MYLVLPTSINHEKISLIPFSYSFELLMKNFQHSNPVVSQLGLIPMPKQPNYRGGPGADMPNLQIIFFPNLFCRHPIIANLPILECTNVINIFYMCKFLCDTNIFFTGLVSYAMTMREASTERMCRSADMPKRNL